jgi:subtilisin family serine protease
MQDDEDSPGPGALPESDPEKGTFTPAVLDRSLIAIPLLDKIRAEGGDQKSYQVIIDLNLEYYAGREEANACAERLLKKAGGDLHREKSDFTDNYLFAEMTGAEVRQFAQLVQKDAVRAAGPKLAAGTAPNSALRAVHRIWLDQELKRLTNASVAIVKGTAAHNAFAALGEGIVWAVADSGIDVTHPHFQTHDTLGLRLPLRHKDFSQSHGSDEEASSKAALRDGRGHGTHVAGIIAGELAATEATRTYKGAPGKPGAEIDSGQNSTDGKISIRAKTRRREEDGSIVEDDVPGLTRMSGVAPMAKLLSLKVLADDGSGLSSNLIVAIAYIQKLNSHGRRLRVHGLNMSVGYDFDPEWFACGQSPLCVEVDRLVRSGVSVVVAAGNTGYGWVQLTGDTARQAGMDLTINDPGNADLAITVGSTHRDMPHTYGVSYFSSKGPTGDGRMKPDLVAPGEKILSCRSAQQDGAQPEAVKKGVTVGHYREDSGTSMAAPHVSGAIAAFLSVRREFIGRPEQVKDVFLASATDLKRDRNFQGAGLLDLMRALQAV